MSHGSHGGQDMNGASQAPKSVLLLFVGVASQARTRGLAPGREDTVWTKTHLVCPASL